jgi:hypothetical protein
MRPIIVLSIGLTALLGASMQACSGNSNEQGFASSGSGSGGGSSSGSGGGSGSGSSSGSSGSSGSGSSSGSSGSSGSGSSSGNLAGDGGTVGSDAGDGSVTITNTVYAHTDDTLFKIDPTTKSPTLIGTFVGTSDSSTDSAITDLAVDSNDDVYVNTESVVYKAALPAGGTGSVQLSKLTTIQSTSKFYALAFAPAGALDANNETLVGGDSTGSLYSINTGTGAIVNLGNFGADKSIAGNTFELSGDIVFYEDASGKPTGLATIRSCPPGGSGSKCKGDYLAGVDMTALKNAYTSGTAATSLLAGIYGGSTAGPGNGTGFADVFGLAAWNSTVFGFSRHTTGASPSLITIDTTSGAGTLVTNSFTFTNGWSGAGVTTKVTISLPPPPPPPAQ